MKIGVMTFFRPINYGAVLQACALSSIVLPRLGYESELIDYRLPRIEYYRKIFNAKEILKSSIGLTRKIYLLLASVYQLPRQYGRLCKFDRFIEKKMNVSKETYLLFSELEDHCQQYDCYIVGSDLVWNPEMTDGVNPAYYFKFVNGKKKISYAASIGTTSINDSDVEKIISNLQDFDCISVREKQTAMQLQSLSQKKIEHVLDPTLLTEKQDWKPYSAQTKKYKEDDYIFAFMLEPSDTLLNAVNQKAKIENLNIITFGSRRRFVAKNVIDISWVGPDEFLEVIQNAKYVYTNSFHGCAFSIIFERQFYCIPHTTRGIRMIDLMNGVGLENRILSDANKCIDNDDIDYTKVQHLLGKQKEQSLSFLCRALMPTKEGEARHEDCL